MEQDDIIQFTVCKYCHQEKAPVNGCTVSNFSVGDVEYPRIKYGDETESYFDTSGDIPCHDCNAKPGQIHHYGCDVEECPLCHEQLIGCECDFYM